MARERFSSRLGFILISAGCAIGLGNVWRFPYIVGKYGGAAFVLLYLAFLVVLGLPIMTMEFSVGRASQKSAALSFNVLEPKGTKWHWYRYGGMAGNYILMMFYTTVGGWMLMYVPKMLFGGFQGLDTEGVSNVFFNMLGQPVEMTVWMLITTIFGFGVCSLGLQKGVERITKVMMVCLLALMVILVGRSVTLPGAAEGLKFYLIPDFSSLVYDAEGKMILGAAVYDAMSQAFFTLSLGIGALAIFGSYSDKSRTLFGEAISVGLLDTFVALIAGLIIFPACFAFGVNPGEGVGLVFMTLPNVFNQMAFGNIWGALFFLFMSFAALSTIIAIFENIIAFAMDLGWSRKKAIAVNSVFIVITSIPCILGFNVWSDFVTPVGNIQDLEDFIVSNNLLPLGSLAYLLFCTSRKGWGWKAFIEEANTGSGLKMPTVLRGLATYVLPVAIVVIFLMGYYQKFFA